MAKPPRSVAENPARAPESLPMGVRAPARITEPAIVGFPSWCDDSDSVEPTEESQLDRSPRARGTGADRSRGGADGAGARGAGAHRHLVLGAHLGEGRFLGLPG